MPLRRSAAVRRPVPADGSRTAVRWGVLLTLGTAMKLSEEVATNGFRRRAALVYARQPASSGARSRSGAARAGSR
eukprot:314850-Pyramimonas_sp.AAC.1